MFKVTRQILVCLSMMSGASYGQEYDVQDWWAPGEIGVALYHARRDFPELTVTQDDKFVPTIDGSGSYCFIRAAFPKERKKSSRSPLNKMTCYLRDTSQRYAILTLDLSDVSLQVWGTKSEYEYWEREGLPKEFHFPNQDINERLFNALYDRREEKSFSYRSDCGQGNHSYCSREMTFNQSRDSENESVFASCIMQYYDNKKISSHCIFYYPDSHN